MRWQCLTTPPCSLFFSIPMAHTFLDIPEELKDVPGIRLFRDVFIRADKNGMFVFSVNKRLISRVKMMVILL